MSAVATWKGEGTETLLFVHATGFCKEVWAPVVESLTEAGVAGLAVAVDQAGHGDAGPVAEPVDWWDLGRALIPVSEGLGTGVIGVGHSSGATALAMAEILRPGAFGLLVLIEPITFPAGAGEYASESLAAGARGRRSTFPSFEAARKHFAGRGIFAGWDERALDAYVGYALRRDDGKVVLKCSPGTEAAFYEAGPRHGAWERLGDVDAPVLLLAGEHSPSHPEQFAREQAARFADAGLEIIPGVGHLLPMEAPAAVAEAIARWLQDAPR